MNQKLKKYAFLVILVGISAAFFISCAGADGKNGVAGTSVINTCTTDCHSMTSATGIKILEAQAQYEFSVHRNGIEEEGTDALYANSSSCVKCHTHDGFINHNPNVAGYTAATTPDWDAAPIGCFTCHSPHVNGDFTLRVANGTSFTVGASNTGTYNKTTGSLCASCHQARTAFSSTLPSTGKSFNANPHHGPQADMLLGLGGATWATDPAVTANAISYSNSNHATNTGAGCPQCHMTLPSAISLWPSSTSSFSFGPDIGGHSFNIRGETHGAGKVNPTGCNVTNCHASTYVYAESIPVYSSTSAAYGYIQKGGQILAKGTWYKDMATLLTKLANPNAGCAGMFSQAFTALGGSIDVEVGQYTYWFNGAYVTENSNCTIRAFWMPATTVTDTNRVNLAKSAWNWMYVKNEDKSMGAHNTKFAMELLYDSCRALAVAKGSSADVDCGATRP